MSFVIAPELVSAAAGEMEGIGSALGAATAAAAAPTTGVAAAAADEVSAAISRLFGAYGQEFQAINAQAAAFHAEFVRLLNGSAAAYLSTEIANAERNLLNALSAGGLAAASSGAAAATAEPLLGLPILGGGSGGIGEILGGSGGLLDPIIFGGTGGLLGPLIGGNGVLTSLVSGGPLGPFFSSLGQQFGTALSALIGGNAASLLANPLPLLTGSLPSLPVLGPLLPGLLPGLFPTPTGGAPAPVSPWYLLISNTNNNLAALGSNWAADPFPFLRQIIANQQGYAVQAGNEISLFVQNLPNEIAHLPENIPQRLQDLANVNPAAFAQMIANDTANDWQTIGRSLAEANRDLQTGLAGFPADWQVVQQDIATGQYNLAVNDATKALLNVFITGFDTSNLNDVRLLGPVADLFPILAIPGENLQGAATLMPPGSIPAQMTNNFANVLNTLTDTSISTTITGTLDPPALVLGANFGLPLSVLFGVAGAPVAALDGLATAGTVIGTGIATGNPLLVLGGFADAPAYVLNGFLNGEVIVDMALPVTFSVPLLGDINIPVVVHLPFQGLLVPPHPITATGPREILGIDTPITLTLGGPQFGGLLPALVNPVPRALADSITPAA
ncbi:PE-PGRS family protein PE_PGRS30 [Mycobacterium simulans]|uniref:PE-PGRS family protein PE_PGRS30 n=1 Tax=Mycobacterium simulans TaxID=627089 RepID=A0A7Z7IMS1_9MYCO|nr:PE family protein [Mycobacterium simulans]SOJ55105.1 PE-PGRS family protein PE_PGRS30 [Mycobacterium simulans]